MNAPAAVSTLPPEVIAAAGRGWRLFPVESRGKLPLVKEWQKVAASDLAQLEAWTVQFPGCNWGLATGTASGLVIIDVDGEAGRASVADLERQGLALPVTLTVTTGRADGGEHRYYRPPSWVDIRNDQSGKIGPHIDVRASGGFVVCPPSIHASGKQYHFIDSSAPVADLPGWIIERLTLRPPMPHATVQVSPQAVGRGSRTNTLVSLAGTMHKRGMSPEAIEAALLAENAAKCDPPLPEAKVRGIAADIVRRYPSGERNGEGLNSLNSLFSQEREWPVLAAPALYGLAGDVVRAVEPFTEADPAAVLIQFIVAFGNCIGGGSHCAVEATRHGLNLFAVLVGETSKARKGTSWGHIRRLFDRVDSEWTSNRVTGGLSSAEGLINEVRDEIDVPTDKRLMVVQDEFASVLRIMSREGNNLSPILRSAWDCGTLRTLVKANPLKATNAHISMIGHITRPELLKYLSETEGHNGFANRLLWVCVKRSKCLPEGGMVPLQTLAELSDRITSAVEWARLEARELRRNDESRKLWAAVYQKLSEGQPGLLGAATSRAEAQTLRLSAVYAALDCSPIIRIDHLRAALAVWDYAFASARFIFGDATGDAVADRIREALESAGAEGLTRTGLSEIFKRHVSSERIGQALAQLAGCGLAESSRIETEGRSIEVWRSAKKAKEAKEGGWDEHL
jgi:hypothetical protein